MNMWKGTIYTYPEFSLWNSLFFENLPCEILPPLPAPWSGNFCLIFLLPHWSFCAPLSAFSLNIGGPRDLFSCLSIFSSLLLWLVLIYVLMTHKFMSLVHMSPLKYIFKILGICLNRYVKPNILRQYILIWLMILFSLLRNLFLLKSFSSQWMATPSFQFLSLTYMGKSLNQQFSPHTLCGYERIFYPFYNQNIELKLTEETNIFYHCLCNQHHLYPDIIYLKSGYYLHTV